MTACNSSVIKTVAALLAAVIVLTACTRSEWLLSFYYNRLEGRLLDRYTEYADFTDYQREWIEDAVGRFHFWHRRVMVPEYAAMLDDVAGTLRRADGPLTMDAVDDWTDRFMRTMGQTHECSPLTRAAPFFVTLDDDQVDQIEASLTAEIEDERTRFEEWEPQDTIDKTFKWLGRLGLNLNEEQKRHFRDAYAEHESLWAESIELKARWNSQLITLLRIRDEPGIQQAIRRHLHDRRGLTRRHHPEQHNKNLRLWKRYALDLLNGLEPGQKADFMQALETHRDNLAGISQKGDRPDNMAADGLCGVPDTPDPDGG
jgi:hypothetical protein